MERTNLKIENPLTKQFIFFKSNGLQSIIEISKWIVVIYSWNPIVDLDLFCLQAKETFHL
jgi:hypothetical protein